MRSKIHVSSIPRLLLGVLYLSACAIHPQAWSPPVQPSFQGALQLNNALTQVEQLSLNGYYGPEDIVMDVHGNLYCGAHSARNDFSNGAILKLSPDGDLSVFYEAESWVAGLHFDPDSNLIALSHKQGLISINKKGEVTVLASHDEKGRPFLIPNGLDIARDGAIYFSNTSHQASYDVKYGRKLILELNPQGALYQYSPKTGEVKTLIEGTYFGNGVVLSKDESFLLLTETSKYRILKYWLKGNRAGTSEVLMSNLPGFPNGISIREDGSFWLGFSTVRNEALDNIHPKKGMKKLIYALPNFLQPRQQRFGMVLNINENGEVLRGLFDPNGILVPEAGAVKEFKGVLYMGGDLVPVISKFHL